MLQKSDGTLAELFDVELHDGSRVISEVVGAEPTVNLAILHTMVFPNGHPRDVKALKFGDSDALECGQWTLGFSDPAGPEKLFTVGSLALPTRDCYQDYLNSFYLQTAMVAHPGAYGGPLVDLAGDVIGSLAPRQVAPGGPRNAPRTGVEFALPSKIVAGLYESIREVRSFQSPWFGFSVMSRAELAAQRGIDAWNNMQKPRTGILIENVWQPSPASAAGILPGDFLCGFDGTRIFTPVDFQRCIHVDDRMPGGRVPSAHDAPVCGTPSVCPVKLRRNGAAQTMPYRQAAAAAGRLGIQPWERPLRPLAEGCHRRARPRRPRPSVSSAPIPWHRTRRAR